LAQYITPASQRRAFRLGVANGILFGLGSALAEPNTVLPVFVSTLTSSKAAIGLLSALAIGGWLLPQLVCAHYLQDRPHKMSLYRWTALIRCSAWLVCVPATWWLAAPAPRLALLLFLAGYALFTLGGGAGSIAFIDIVAKTVPVNRLGSFFGARAIGGGLLAIAAGGLVRYLLGPAGPGYPANYGLLFALAGLMCSVALATFAFIREPAGASQQKQGSLLQFLLSAPSLLAADANFRRLFLTSLLVGGAWAVAPFYIIYARDQLAMPAGMLGFYLSVQMVGSVVSNILWMPLGDRRSGKTVVQVSAAVTTLVPLLAWLITMLGLVPGQARLAFSAVFLLAGAGGVGGFISSTKYLIELAPEADRPRYAGAFNTFSAASAAFPVLAGVLIDASSFRLAFALAAACGLVGVLVAQRLQDLGRAPGEEFLARLQAP